MIIHFIPNEMFPGISICSQDPQGKGTYDWSEVTCDKCLKEIE